MENKARLMTFTDIQELRSGVLESKRLDILSALKGTCWI